MHEPVYRIHVLTPYVMAANIPNSILATLFPTYAHKNIIKYKSCLKNIVKILLN